ncbi:MAG TPA: helix-turn-helix domain-containing protein [Alphaproteobacteria bacterium]|jgi:transcriptional regulator with XRE-family HTH domain|nr:helix-turn-helix domain-containing protein [Alphaproteobacteria bacterium]
MTPFGARIRALRAARGISLKRMAADLELSQAYLSALEHGQRGRPTPALVIQICEYFHLIWDDYEEMHRLARLSHPRAIVDTRGLSPAATELANLLADRVADLDDATLAALADKIKASPPSSRRKLRRGRLSIASGRPRKPA